MTGFKKPRMLRLATYLVAGLVVVSACLSVGCKKNSGAAGQSSAPDASKLPGASEVFSALDKKDYDGVLAALVKVEQAVATDEQKVQYMVLTRKVKDKLLELADSDPKAMSALGALRGMGQGR